MQVEALVKLPDTWVICIRNQDVCATGSQVLSYFGKALLVRPRKELFIVVNKSVASMTSDVWWIKEHEVACTNVFKNTLKIVNYKPYTRECECVCTTLNICLGSYMV